MFEFAGYVHDKDFRLQLLLDVVENELLDNVGVDEFTVIFLLSLALIITRFLGFGSSLA